jgi:hypothetical protein
MDFLSSTSSAIFIDRDYCYRLLLKFIDKTPKVFRAMSKLTIFYEILINIQIQSQIKPFNKKSQ